MGIFKKKLSEDFDCRKTKEFFENNRNPDRKDFLRCPEWMEPEYDENGNYIETPDELYMLFDPFMQRRFYKEGKVALGALIQANVQLFDKGDTNCPACYLYTADDYYWDHPDELEILACAVAKTKGEQGYIPSMQKIADILADETGRNFRHRLPRNVTEGREVYYTTLFVQREHLPHKKIVGRSYPLLILEDAKPDAMILPYWYWKV